MPVLLGIPRILPGARLRRRGLRRRGLRRWRRGLRCRGRSSGARLSCGGGLSSGGGPLEIVPSGGGVPGGWTVISPFSSAAKVSVRCVGRVSEPPGRRVPRGCEGSRHGRGARRPCVSRPLALIPCSGNARFRGSPRSGTHRFRDTPIFGRRQRPLASPPAAASQPSSDGPPWASRTSRILRTSSSGSKGFGTKEIPSSRIPSRPSWSAGYPEA